MPPVLELVDEVIAPEFEAEVCDAVVSEAAVVEDSVVDAEVSEAALVVAPAVMVTGREVISLLARVVVCVPGKLASEPLSISVQTAAVVPPTEQIMCP
jgi:hypothetical protein